MLACVLQRSLAGSTFNIHTSFCSFSGFLLDVVTRSVETQEWKRLLPKLDAMQTAWRRWVTFQYSFSEGGRFKTICTGNAVFEVEQCPLSVSRSFKQIYCLKDDAMNIIFTSIVDFERNNRHLQ